MKSLVTILIALQIAPATAFASQIPPGLEKERVGILRWGGGASAQADRAYPLVEKRVQRWLENFDGIHARAETLGLSIPGTAFRLEATAARLAELATKLERSDDRALVDESRRLRGQLPWPSEFGPVLQENRVGEAAFLWRAGEKREAVAMLEEAARLNPQRDVAALGRVEESMPGLSLAFEAARQKHRDRAVCEIDLETPTPGTEFRVNGFPFDGRRLSLRGKDSVTVTATAVGRGSVERVFRCARQERKRWVAALPGVPTGRAPREILTGLRSEHGVHSLLLIEPRDDEFRLYLFSPDSVLEEVPLRERLRVAEVLERPGETELPIATDAFLEIYKRHRFSAPLALGEGARLDALPYATSREEMESTRWYNSWTFWAIAGGIAGGAAIAYLATRNDHPVQTQGGVFIKLAP